MKQRKASPGEPLQNRSGNSYTEQIYQKLHHEIISCEIKPNETLVESELADRFGVSKTPVREALVQLSQEGWVTPSPRIGYEVKGLQIRDIHEVCYLRKLLEGEAAALAARKATQEQIDEMRAIQEEKRRKLEREAGDKMDYLEYHDVFHLNIAALSGYNHLEEFISRLLNETTRMRMTDPLMNISGFAEEQDVSEKIYRAIEEGDSDGARTLLEEHISDSKRRIIEAMIREE